MSFKPFVCIKKVNPKNYWGECWPPDPSVPTGLREQSWTNGKIRFKSFHTSPLQLKYFVKTSDMEKSFDLIFLSLWRFRTLAYDGYNNLKQPKVFFSPGVLKRSSNIDERSQALKLVLVTCVVSLVLYLDLRARTCSSVICILKLIPISITQRHI